MKDIELLSKRNTLIKASISITKGKAPLVMFAHSFKSNRQEDGRYEQIIDSLAKDNIYSITFDFPGNGESKEEFIDYSLDNCLSDMETCYEYMLNNYDIDNDHMALVGYSMGGRLISLFYNLHPEFNNLVFWAAFNNQVSINDKFLEQDLLSLKIQADKDGYCDFYDIFAKEYGKLSADFINNLLDYDALEPLNRFNGNSLIIQGNKDITIAFDNCLNLYKNLKSTNEKKLLIINGADHGFGLWDNRIQDNELLIKETLQFLRKSLMYSFTLQSSIE